VVEIIDTYVGWVTLGEMLLKFVKVFGRAINVSLAVWIWSV